LSGFNEFYFCFRSPLLKITSLLQAHVRTSFCYLPDYLRPIDVFICTVPGFQLVLSKRKESPTFSSPGKRSQEQAPRRKKNKTGFAPAVSPPSCHLAWIRTKTTNSRSALSNVSVLDKFWRCITRDGNESSFISGSLLSALP